MCLSLAIGCTSSVICYLILRIVTDVPFFPKHANKHRYRWKKPDGERFSQLMNHQCSLFTLFTNSSYEMPSRIALRLLCIVFSHLYTPQLSAHHQAQVFYDR